MADAKNKATVINAITHYNLIFHLLYYLQIPLPSSGAVYSTTIAMRTLVKMMFSDAYPRRISVSKLIVGGIQTAPTKRPAAAKLAIKMLEFVCNCLTFLLFQSLRCLKGQWMWQATVAMTIASWREVFCVESQMNLNWGELEQKISSLEELPSCSLG